MNYLIVALGSALGGMARFWVVSLQLPGSIAGFPTGTLLVNILGSFLIGCFAVVIGASAKPGAAHAQLFFMVGLFGGFTTFSAFSLQVVNMIQSGQSWLALGYILASLLLCILCAAAGYWCAEAWINR